VGSDFGTTTWPLENMQARRIGVLDFVRGQNAGIVTLGMPSLLRFRWLGKVCMVWNTQPAS
jgi:hypothetical protein